MCERRLNRYRAIGYGVEQTKAESEEPGNVFASGQDGEQSNNGGCVSGVEAGQ